MMFKFLSKNFYISFSIVTLIYFLDRLTKIFVIQLDKNNLGSDIFNSAYLNIALIWNKGIAFGLFSFNEVHLYNILSLIISIIVVILVIMSLKSHGFKRYTLLMVVGGALGNLHDRIFFNEPEYGDLVVFKSPSPNIFIGLNEYFTKPLSFITNGLIEAESIFSRSDRLTI